MIKDINEAKEILISFFGSKEELKKDPDNILGLAIMSLAENACNKNKKAMLRWLAEEENNYRYVEEGIRLKGIATDENGNFSLLENIHNGQEVANEILLERAAKEIKEA
jgi:ankyrin repeat protein